MLTMPRRGLPERAGVQHWNRYERGQRTTARIGKSWAVFASVELWIGALAGAAMIYAAIRLRRWRDDN